ncbi:FIST N-terminal domain-containing protein [Sandarakinorhabdus sp.]|uniref:FIST N-terminal domain-containing protein n=1 Tax=Sandarakinorhabdus sp. TaxID=1916663 RepID=UPI003F71017C
MPAFRPVTVAGAGNPVRVAHSMADEPEMAVREVMRALDLPDLAGVILFCSSRYPIDALGPALAMRANGHVIIACTSSGEITPQGLAEGSLTAIGFPASDFRFDALCLDNISQNSAAETHDAVRRLAVEAETEGRARWGHCHHAGIFLIDGLSAQEELLTLTIQNALGQVPLVGGSSGDSLVFRETFVFHQSHFRRDAAVVAMLSSRRPLHVFRAQHFRPGPARMVITGADPTARIVHEINAEPAAEEYARLIGSRVADLTPALFASHPPIVRIGGEYYARSIRAANPDGSLTFYGAIDEGVVMTLGHTGDIVASLEALFAELEVQVGGIDRVLAFDCVLNGLEIRQRQLAETVSRLYARSRVVGFNTYGEQVRTLHMNQTFSGLAIGRG